MPDYTQAISQFVVDSPTSYHAAQAVAARLEKRGFKAVDETVAWDSSIPARGYVIRDGAIAAWCLPSALASALASGLWVPTLTLRRSSSSPRVRLCAKLGNDQRRNLWWRPRKLLARP